MSIVLESRVEFNNLKELFAWRAKFARHMFLTGSNGHYKLVNTASKSASAKTSRPFLAQKSE